MNPNISIKKTLYILVSLFLIIILILFYLSFTKLSSSVSFFISSSYSFDEAKVNDLEKELEKIVGKPVNFTPSFCPAMPGINCDTGWGAFILFDNYIQAKEFEKELKKEFPKYDIQVYSWFSRIREVIKEYVRI